MANVASSSDSILTSLPHLEASDLLQELSLGSDTQGVEVTDVANKKYGENGSLACEGGFLYPLANTQVPLSSDAAKGNSNTVLTNGNANKNSYQKRGYQQSSFNQNGSYTKSGYVAGVNSSGYPDPRFSSNGSPAPGRNSNLYTYPHYLNSFYGKPAAGLGQSYGYIDMYSDHGLYGHYGNMLGAGYGYGAYGYDAWKHGQGWYAYHNAYRTRGRNFGGYGKENVDGLNELNRGPRSKNFKVSEGFQATTLSTKEQNTPSGGNTEENSCFAPDMKQFNRDDFPDSYADAKFFVIKSYSEDDIHKSIKYNVWSSTPNGNKKLDAAYSEAKEMPKGCPIFLLFSVNTSGQFVGLAEMVGPVDFNKTVEYWQQDKWIGCFPVKWHIIKDVPNGSLRHITLENNENKPVTNSRDTQEVYFDQGIKILKIFKEHISKTCVLDDFGFYENRQKIIQEKKAKQQQSKKQVFDRKLENGSVNEDKDADTKVKTETQKTEVPTDATNGESKLLKENGTTVEKSLTANGVASAC